MQVERDIEDYSNALNKLQQQLDKISDAVSEEQVHVISCFVLVKCTPHLMCYLYDVICYQHKNSTC